MKIAILGTKGIPNNYGGFEQCAEQLSIYFFNKCNSDVYVYCTKSHNYKGNVWQGINLIHINDFKNIPFLSSIIYDFLCILDARMQSFDIIIQLGYSPAGLFYKLLKKNKIPIITNMAGMEWKRSKWNNIAKTIIKISERKAVNQSDIIVSDNIGIKKYIDDKYKINSFLIAYGADIPEKIEESLIDQYSLKKHKYFLVIARLQKDNNIEIILNGYIKSKSKYEILIIGSLNNNYAKYLLKKYHEYSNIKFLGGVYNQDVLNAMRKYCNIYFHGHSVGGTNPSLLEAMASEARIVAYDNIFNRSVLNNNALYFKNENDIAYEIKNFEQLYKFEWINKNKDNIAKNYQWNNVGQKYYELIRKLKEGRE